MRLRNLLSIFLMCMLPAISSAQSADGKISGIVTDASDQPLVGITVYIEELQRGTATDLNGRFELDDVKPGIYELRISGVGFKTTTKAVKVSKDQSLKLELILQNENVEIEEVVIQGKSTAEEVRETGYTVEVIRASELKSLSTDINQVLQSAPGIQIREKGGMGSSFSLSLNGLSGNQVRYFIDGIPMENFGSALTLNNFPVNLIDNIEVYKGVVPVWLGADALGGAINITTAYREQSFLDLSHSYGSFNTHRAAINGQYADSEKGYLVRLLSYFNYSDNSYEMQNVPVYDLELGNKKANIDAERFNNEYVSGMGRVEAGLINRSFADVLTVGVTYAKNRKNYQHPDNNISSVFGKFHSKNETILASADYRKEFERLSLNTYVLTGEISESVVDTSNLKYNWAQETIQRNADNPKGEVFERKSFMVMDDRVLRSNLGGSYTLSPNHRINVNLSQNYLERTGEDRVNEFNQSYESPNYIHKNIAGAAYTFSSAQENLELTAFAKQYWYEGKIVTLDTEDNEVVTEPSFSNTGYGALITWKPAANLQLKTSFEKTYRIPESFEILGDGIYVLPNPDLSPEHSYNVNAGLRYRTRISSVNLKSEINYFLRSSESFIRFNPLGPFGSYENLDNVRTNGLEGSLQADYRQWLTFSVNLTWQNLRDRTRFDEGLPNTNYNSRIPNVPYLFGNTRIGVKPFIDQLEGSLSMYWSTKYVHEFYLTWANLGNARSKNEIPRQIVHDLQVEYGFRDRPFSLSVTVNNITDALVYDNFNIQKPGRAVYIKLGYFLN